MEKDNTIIVMCLICLTLFSFMGWYMAEADNEVLRKELSHYTGQEIRK